MILIKILLSLSFFSLATLSVFAQNIIDDSAMREVYLDRGFSPIGEGECWNTVERTNSNKVIKICQQQEPEIFEFTYIGYSREEILLTDAIEVDNAGKDLYAASAVRNYILGRIEEDNFNLDYPWETFARQNSHTGEVTSTNSIVHFSLEGKEKIVRIEVKTQQQ